MSAPAIDPVRTPFDRPTARKSAGPAADHPRPLRHRARLERPAGLAWALRILLCADRARRLRRRRS